jgi:hypothetical protein
MIINELFCRHKDLKFLGNVYGDLIDAVSTYKKINRSAWRCKKCGKIIFKEIFGDISHESYNDYLRRMQSKCL